MGIQIVVQQDKANGALSVLFRVQNEPILFLGESFEVRSTTLGSVSWSDASVGRLPKEVTQDLPHAEIEILVNRTLDALIAYNKAHSVVQPS